MLGVTGDHLIKGCIAAARVFDVDAHRELFLGRTDAARHESWLAWIFARKLVGRAPGKLGRPLIDLEHVLFEPKLFE